VVCRNEVDRQQGGPGRLRYVSFFCSRVVTRRVWACFLAAIVQMRIGCQMTHTCNTASHSVVHC
jgi:hypothetical protein